jgi:hypothetical protein
MHRRIAVRIVVGIALHSSCAKASSILGSANTATVLNVAGSAVNVATGALNFNEAKKEAAKCASSDGSDQAACDKSALYYAMGTLNLAQAAAQAVTAGSSSSTAASTDTSTGTTSSSSTNTTSSDATTAAVSTDPEVAAGLTFAANVAANQDKTLSYNASTGTVTTASGSTLSTSAVSSAGTTSSGDSSSSLKSTMNSIAATEDQIAAKAIAKVSKLKNIAAAVNGEEASTGGGAGGPPAVGGGSGEVKQGIVLAPRPSKVTPVAASVEGLQKNFNGTPVGVAGDNIFKMVQRRYHLKDSQSTFLNESDLIK